MNKTKFTLLSTLMLVLFLFACNSKKESKEDPRIAKMSKTWEYYTVDIEGTIFPGEQMASPRMKFGLDSVYTMRFQNVVDSGKWFFKGDTLVTTTFSNPGEEEYLVLDSLTDDLVVLSGETNGKGLILTMKAVKE